MWQLKYKRFFFNGNQSFEQVTLCGLHAAVEAMKSITRASVFLNLVNDIKQLQFMILCVTFLY